MILRALILVFAALLLAATPVMAEWNFQTVDNSGDVGLWSSIAYDSQGYPHIAYFDETNDDLRYAHWNGSGGWIIETVASAYASGRYCSIAVDQFDTPHVAYTNQTSGYRYCIYAHRTGNDQWSTETITYNTGGHDYEHTAIALTYDELWEAIVPHVCYYYASNGSLYYAFKNPETSTWVSEIVDGAGNVGRWSSMVLDGDGHIYISYYDDGGKDLKFAHFNGSEWGTFIVDGAYDDVGMYSSITLDLDGNPHITYYDEVHKDLKHATISLGDR